MSNQYACKEHGGKREDGFCVPCLQQEKATLLAAPYPHDKAALRYVNRLLRQAGCMAHPDTYRTIGRARAST